FAQQRFVPDDHFLAPNSSLVQKELCEIFEQVPQDLKLPDLVMVKIKGDQLEVYQPGLDQTKKYSVKENCQKHSEYTRCIVPGWGAANLLSQISDKSQSQ